MIQTDDHNPHQPTIDLARTAQKACSCSRVNMSAQVEVDQVIYYSNPCQLRDLTTYNSQFSAEKKYLLIIDSRFLTHGELNITHISNAAAVIARKAGSHCDPVFSHLEGLLQSIKIPFGVAVSDLGFNFVPYKDGLEVDRKPYLVVSNRGGPLEAQGMVVYRTDRNTYL